LTALRENEQKTLLALQKLDGKGNTDQIAQESGLAHAAVMRAALTLAEKKLVQVSEKKQVIITLNKEGKDEIEVWETGGSNHTSNLKLIAKITE
jgi:hypothetical protein